MLGIAGILLHNREDRETRLVECWLALAAGAALLLVASSQWQGISNDRYLGWMIPLWVIYISIGLDELDRRISARYFMPLCLALLGAYQLASTAYVASNAYTSAVWMENHRKLATRIEESFSPDTRFGSTVGTSISYFMPRHPVQNLLGITAPDFFFPGDGMKLHRLIDHLKHQPELRFDYWLISENFLKNAPWAKPLTGELVMQDTDTALFSKSAFGIYETVWDTIDGGYEPQLIQEQLERLTLIDSMDVGHLAHEAEHDYATELRIKHAVLPTMAATDTLGDREYTEAGRIILGSESFTVNNVEAGYPLTIVLRTGRQTSGKITQGRHQGDINRLELNEELHLRIFVDEQEILCPALDISGDGFREVVMNIPAAVVQRETPRIKVIGDHISYAYWFYQ